MNVERSLCRASRAALLAAVCTCPPLHAQAPVAPRSPTRYLVGVDRSASRTPQQMKDMRVFLEHLTGALDFGDELSVVEVLQHGSDAIREFRDSLPRAHAPQRPTRRELGMRDALRQTFRFGTLRYTDTTGMAGIRSTDIVGFLWRAAEYAQSGTQRRTVVIVLSDMVNSTPVLNFERANGVPDSLWVARRAGGGLLPNLRGVCVAAAGAALGTPKAVRLQAFWRQYFRASGATFPEANYRSVIVPTDVRCSER